MSKTRWVVERTFGSQKRWFGVGQTRLKGLDKVHTHTTYFGSYCLQSEAKSEDGNTSCLLMKKRLKKGRF
ncbi:transposase [Bergeyella zoohelcum]|uniref:transposase n=1 Tax=Bergeyella zoohelcum TaxID=1015 RepID=UPI0009DA1B9D